MEGSGPALSNCVKEAFSQMAEFCRLHEFMGSGPEGLQASVEQLCEESKKENGRVMQGA